MTDVVVSGFGVFTAFGFGAQSVLDGVFGGRHAFTEVSRFDPTPFRATHAATYPDAITDSLAHTPGPRLSQRDALRACAEAAVAMAGAPEPGADVPVLVGTSGDLNHSAGYWRRGDSVPVADTLPVALAEEVARAVGLAESGRRAPRTAFINACVASTSAVIGAARMIRDGRAELVVCGGSYVVGEMTFSIFDSGRAMSRDGRVRPFSRDRSGLLLGDGAAVLVLESAEHASRRGAEPLARLSGWGMAADAHHVVQPHPRGDGLVRAAGQALAGAGVAAADIDYVNAHGTGTELNDRAETAAFHRLFGPSATTTPISSTKGATGHMLEATGAVELVITILALRHGLIPPTAGYGGKDPHCDLDYVPNQSRTAPVRRALTLNAAFGGMNAALLVEQP